MDVIEKNTPGPWAIGKHDDYPNSIEAVDPFMRGNMNLVRIAEIFPIGGEDDEQHIFNMRLIAAAPDLLEALKRLCDYAKKPTQADWQAADAAIAKATGEPK